MQELSQLPRRMGGMTGVLIYAFALVALGVLLPWYLSFDFLDAMIPLAYACLPALLVAPVVAESFAGDGERAQLSETPEGRRRLLYAKVLAGAIYGWISALLALVMGLTTVSLSLMRPIFPPPLLAFDLVVMSLAVSVSAAGISAAVSVKARSAKYAKRSLRQGFLLLLVLAIYCSRFMPVEWKHRVIVPGTLPGFTEFIVVTSLALVVLSAGLIKLALSRGEDTEIRLNL
jgi:tryptophan-rich sensory protein